MRQANLKNQRLKRHTNKLKLFDVCGFKDFKTMLTFKSLLKLTQFVIEYTNKKITLLQKHGTFPWLGQSTFLLWIVGQIHVML
jgi:uncharacterized membrane protein